MAAKDRLQMKLQAIAILICSFISCSTTAMGQSVKLTKEEKKQERKSLDSLYIVYSLPVSMADTKEFTKTELRDSIINVFKSRKYYCPDDQTVSNLIREKMLDFLPSPITEKERYLETIQKVAKDKNYYFTLMELADPFLQAITLTFQQSETGNNMIIVKRQNFPNGRKSRIWTFKYEESESVNNLATRIVDTLTNTKQSQ